MEQPQRKTIQCLIGVWVALFLLHVCTWTGQRIANEHAHAMLLRASETSAMLPTFTAPRERIERLSQCSNAVWAHSRFAFVTLITMDSPLYKLSAQKLGVMLQQWLPEVDRILITDHSISNLFDLKHSGWKVCLMDLIDGPKAAEQHANTNRFIQTKMYSKFNVWKLTQYEAVCFLDSDTMVVGDPSDLFTRHFPQMKQQGFEFAAALDRPMHNQCLTGWNMPEGSFNAGVLLFQPNLTVAEHLVQSIERVPHNSGMAEQGLLNALYPDFYKLPFELSGNAVSKACEPAVWALHPPRIVHMTVAKGWMGSSSSPNRGFTLINDCWWWDLQDYCAFWEMSPIHLDAHSALS